LADYFDLGFTALPHKVLAAEQFEAEVQKLRQRFEDKSRPDYLFKPVYHKRIPADGVAFYMEGIWVSVPELKSGGNFENDVIRKGTSANEQRPRLANATGAVGTVPV
jgi:hypothetical protein